MSNCTFAISKIGNTYSKCESVAVLLPLERLLHVEQLRIGNSPFELTKPFVLPKH